MFKIFCFWFVYTLCSREGSDAYTLTDVENLWTNITTGYNKNHRPVQNQHKSIDVSINFALYSIQEINELTGKISVTGSIELIWEDEKLVWNPADYNTIYSMMVPISEVWYPPLIIGNPDTTSTAIKIEERSFVRLLPDGTIMFIPSGVYSVHSPLNAKHYPFDKQTFDIQFVVPGFINTEVKLMEGNTTYISSSFKGNGEWSLLKLTREVTVESQYTSVATFTISLERKSTNMVVNIILPIMFLAVINLLVFVLPPDAGERVSFSVTLLLSLAVFMTLVGDNLPKTSDPLPVLSYYLLATLTLSTLMCVMAILNLSIYHKNEQSRPPKCIAVVAAAVLCRNKFLKAETEKDVAEEENTKPANEKRSEKLTFPFKDNQKVMISWKDI
ncbi:acetylcholine receptor subunit beta-like 1 [Mya arenaria]|uniref:acetylcholine receptor subunit beta-like 1 n=1 Tax=Mya arenaria TaxID=6604 RepID=UPI0022DF37D6|nr:acetylcholine receptor subunit beta-like 1 [Mya arenaria]